LIFGQAFGWDTAALCFVAGYLLGSIPFGLIFARLAGAGDVRKIGSGNIGATNVLRTGKRWAAAATLLCDAGKGALAAGIGHFFYGVDGAIFAGLGAFLGHLFPIWLGFKGGKGVATFLGVALALSWPAGLLCAATWIAVAALWRISSLSALIAAALSPLYMFFMGEVPYTLLMLALAVMIFIMHRENIGRLMRGKEPRIGATDQSA
jgi:glycerol-3-phosphate acyltransferase PlsY